MLVLSRQRDETIMIGDDIELTVVDIRGDKVRLGIKAPTRIAVHRKEVYDSIRCENEQSAALGELPPKMKPSVYGSGTVDIVSVNAAPSVAANVTEPDAGCIFSDTLCTGSQGFNGSV